jgi:pilus assembly protein CpaC
VAPGESLVRVAPRAVTRFLLSDPSIAEVRLLSQDQYQVRGLARGSTDLWIWYADAPGRPHRHALAVGARLEDLQKRVNEAAPGAGVRVSALRDRIVAEGTIADAETLERVARVLRVHDPSFVNLLTVRADQQVQLKVTFAEVNRSSLRQMGLNGLYSEKAALAGVVGPQTSTVAGRLRTAARGAVPSVNDGLLGAASSGAFQIVGWMGGAPGGAAILSVLEENDLARTLARPTLVALSGQSATFHGGGRIPIPVQQQNNQVSISFEEYGVRLRFVPTVLAGEIIDVQATVEVSELDPGNALRLSGVEVPAIRTRRGESRLRLGSGSTFALAGMLSERTTSTRSAIPLLGDIPVVGSLFRFVRHDRSDTELVIFVTPELVKPIAPGQAPSPPGAELVTPGDLSLFLLGHAGGAGQPAAVTPVGPAGMER